MAASTLQNWLDWWESKGKAISYCYIGNGGRVVTPGTSSQAGTSITVGGSTSGSIPGGSAPRPPGEAPGDGTNPIPVVATVVSTVTNIESLSKDGKPLYVQTVTTYSNGAKTVTTETMSGWSCYTTFPDGSSQHVSYDRYSKETTTRLQDQYSTATFVNGERGNLISGHIERKDGTWDRLAHDPDDNHWVQTGRRSDHDILVDYVDGGRRIQRDYFNGTTDIEKYNEDGVLIYQAHIEGEPGDPLRTKRSTERTEHGSTIEITRTETRTDNWFSRGYVTDIEETRTVRHAEGDETTHTTRTRIETDLSNNNHAEPSRIERAFDWFTDSVKDLWESTPEENTGTAPKAGTTSVDTGAEKYVFSILAGTASNDDLSGSGIVAGGNGNDKVSGSEGNDILFGGTGHDTSLGGLGADYIDGGDEADSLEGGGGSDTLVGGNGRDTLLGGDGSDALDGGKGVDFASYEKATSGVVVNLSDPMQNIGEAGGDTYTSIEGVAGSAYDDRIAGSAANNILYGYNGNDRLVGIAGDDLLIGGAGADRLEGGDGFDVASYAPSAEGLVVNLSDTAQNTGDAAGDVYYEIEGLVGSEHVDTLIGSNGDNRLEGGGGNDILDAMGGRDAVYGDDGDDRLFSEMEADTLDGGTGWDTVSYYKLSFNAVAIYLWDVTRNGGAAKGDVYIDIEVIDGTRLADIMEGDSHKNTFWGDNGNDSLKGGAGDDELSGGNDDDLLDGGTGHDTLNGGSGFDTVTYAHAMGPMRVDLGNTARNLGEAYGDLYSSIEKVIGSAYNDTLEGSSASDAGDIFEGGEGQDLLKGYGGADTLKGGHGDDQLAGGAGVDVLDGGDGYDFAVHTDAAGGVVADLSWGAANRGEAQFDMYISIEGLMGSAFDDQLYGDAGGNTLLGERGSDRLEGRAGGDLLDGGQGIDHAVYWGASSGVTASLLTGYGSGGDAGGDVYRSIEGLEGSGFGDTLQGDHQANTLYGYGGADLLQGEGGHDYIEGGSGTDTVSGGEGLDWLLGNAGADLFRFNTRLSSGNVDTLADFSVAQGDRIGLSASVFGSLPSTTVIDMVGGLPVGRTMLKSSAFKVGAAATAWEHRIVYDQATGTVYFDVDGVGGIAQVQFAKVAAGTALTAAQFMLV